MKKLLTILALATLPLTAGCLGLTPEPEGKPFCAEECEPDPEPDPDPDPEPVESPELIGAFVSGHLGNYWDCPEEAYHGESTTVPGSGLDGTEGDFAPCPEDDDQCTNAVLNCETAQITIQLSNTGDVDATDVLVDTIELRNLDDVAVASLPLHTVTDIDTNQAFDGVVEVGEKLMLRIEYAGPADPYQLLRVEGDASGDRAFGGGGAGIIHTTFSAENHDDLTVESSEVYSVPSVDT